MRRSVFPFPALVLLSLACGGEYPAGHEEDDPGSTFEIHVVPMALEIEVGADKPVVVAVSAPDGEQAPTVYLSLDDLPDGVDYHPERIPAGSSTATVWLTARIDATPVLDAPVRVIGTTTFGTERETTFTLTVKSLDPTDCDPTFGIGGIEGLDGLATAVVGMAPLFNELTVLPDGTILAVGSRGDGAGWLARWDSDGFPDPFFGQAGVMVFEGFAPAAVTVGPEGAVYLAGYTREIQAPALARLSGSNLDPDFDRNSPYVRLAAGRGEVRALATFGSVVAASLATPSGHVLTRYDLTGRAMFPPTIDGPAPSVSRFAADGSLVGAFDTSVFRFDAEGNWDRSFGPDGSLSMPSMEIGALLPHGPDGGFLVGGSKYTSDARGKASVTRVVGDGIDPAFSVNLSWRWETAVRAHVVDLVPFGAGAAAIAHEEPTGLVDVVVFDEWGRVRTTLGIDGIFPLPFLGQSPQAHLAVDRTGRLLAGAVGGDNFVAICRLLTR